MAASILHEPGEQYETRNNFLYFILGLVSLSESFLELAEPSATPLQPEADSSPPGETQKPYDFPEILR